MDVEAARIELIRAAENAGQQFRAAHEVLIRRGLEALHPTPEPGNAVGVSLDEVVRTAAEAPQTRALRGYAVLLVHALGVPGLLPPRGETERRIQSFLERVLLNPLRRGGYPFDGTPYDKREALARLHMTIDEHLRPLEPTMPRWLQGLETRDES
jgi:hypothetical protein